MTHDPPSGYHIQRAMSAWQSARARLLVDDADLAHDEHALAALLGPVDGDVRDILCRVLTAAQHAASMADAAANMISDMTARRDRYKRRNETLRQTAYAIMDAIGSRKEEFPHVTAVMRAGVAAAIVTDEAALPERFIRTKREPDRSAILAALKDGEVIEGAELTNTFPSLQLRSR
jgi:hypothetical protein